MLDLVFAVDDPAAWHEENLRRNGGHYSALGWLGAAAVARLQTRFGARLWYNTLVSLPEPWGPRRLMKYGVISRSDLVDDLVNWRTMYVSGRMHKPVRVLRAADDIDAAASVNLRSALAAALLMLPQSFTAEQLFTAIAGLSYRGDFRMTFGENPNKVRNIVSKGMDNFRALYTPVWESSDLLGYDAERDEFTQEVTSAARAETVRQLPERMQYAMAAAYARTQGALPFPRALRRPLQRRQPGKVRQRVRRLQQEIASAADGRRGADERVRTALLSSIAAGPPELSVSLLQPVLAGVVGRYATSQSIKGVLTAGVGRSVRYAFAKLQKYSAAVGKRSVHTAARPTNAQPLAAN